MQTKNILIVLFGFSLITLTGCVSFELTKYEDEKNCQTTIEGNYFRKSQMASNLSIIYVKTDDEYSNQVRGRLISYDSTGIIFDPMDYKLYSEDEAFYPIDTLTGVIDSTSQLLYGSIPSYFSKKHNAFIFNYKLHLGITNRTTYEYDELHLLPNEPFAYCIKPGEYEITDIKFVKDENYIDIGADFPKIYLQIDSGKANYLGDLYADFTEDLNKDVMKIYCSNYNSDAAFATGFMFGIIGAAVYTASMSIPDEDLFHIIRFENKKAFVPEANMEMKEIEMKVETEED